MEDNDGEDYDIPFYNANMEELPSNVKHYTIPYRIENFLNNLYQEKGLIYLFYYQKSGCLYHSNIIQIQSSNPNELQRYFAKHFTECCKVSNTTKMQHKPNQTLIINEGHRIVRNFIYPSVLMNLNNGKLDYTTVSLE